MARRKMTQEHKDAIAAGRSEGAAVKRYLETLGQKGKPGRRVSRDELARRLDETDQAIPEESNALSQLDLIQKRIDLERRIQNADAEEDSSDAEAAFIEVAANYARRKKIPYSAFRTMGVPPEVLKEAGVRRTRS